MRRASLRLLAALFLVLLGGVSFESLSPTVLLAGSITVALSIAAWWIATGAAVALPPLAILIPASGLLILELLSLLWTPFPAAAYRSLVEAVLIGAFFLMALSSLSTGWQPRNWQDAFILLGLALTLLELALLAIWLWGWQIVPGSHSWLPPVGYRSSGLLLGHANVLAGLINLTLPLLFVRAVRNWSRFTGKLIGLPVGILLLGLFLTSSRAGWLSGMVGMLATLILLVLAFSNNRIGPALSRVAGRVRPWQIAAGAAMALVIGTAAFWQVSRTGHQPLAGARTPVWSASLQIISQEPVLGHGLRSYPVSYASLPSEHSEEDIPHAHNLLLQVGAETGLVGTALLLALLWGVARVGWKLWMRSDASQRVSLAALGGAGAAFLSHAMFDYLLGPAIYSLAAVTLLGLLLANEQDGPKTLINDRRFRLAIALTPLAAALLLVVSMPGAWSYWDGSLAARENRWMAASRDLCAAHERNPADPIAASSCGLARQIAAYQTSEDPSGAVALQALQSAASLDRAWGPHWGNLGASELGVGQYQRAALALDRGLEVYPVSPDLLLTRGLAAERLGDRDGAVRLYRTALEINPWIWDSAYLQAETYRLEGIEAALLADALPPAERWTWSARLAIDQGDLESAEQALQTAATQGAQGFRISALRAEVALLAGDPQTALSHAQQAAFLAPDHVVVREIQAVVLAAQDSAEAQQALVRAAESLVFQSRSRRYFSSAYGKLGLPTDISPDLILGNLSARLARMASAALASEGQALEPLDRLILAILIEHCGCSPETDAGANLR